MPHYSGFLPIKDLPPDFKQEGKAFGYLVDRAIIFGIANRFLDEVCFQQIFFPSLFRLTNALYQNSPFTVFDGIVGIVVFDEKILSIVHPEICESSQAILQNENRMGITLLFDY